MEKIDKNDDYKSPHHVEYDLLMDHVVQDDHELLYLDTFLREALQKELQEEKVHAEETN